MPSDGSHTWVPVPPPWYLPVEDAVHKEDEGSLQAVDDGEDEGHHYIVTLCLQEAQTPRAAQDTDVRQRLERHQPDRTLILLFFSTQNPSQMLFILPPKANTLPTNAKTHRVFFRAVTSALREESLSCSVQRVVRKNSKLTCAESRKP